MREPASASTISEWLEELGLAQYAAAFVQHDIDVETLRHLTAEDLRDLGVISIGHRRKFLDAIAQLALPPGEIAAAREPAVHIAPVEPPAAIVSERRYVTTMFCDLVGFTPLAVSLDPEAMHEILGAYKDACTAVIRRNDGHVVKFLGDGVLASFGYPRAAEDDGIRCVDAGLEIVTAVSALRTPDGRHLAARVGIATGLVIVGDQVGRIAVEHDALVGEAPNLAARLQAAAEPGQVLVSRSTMKLLGLHFQTQPLGEIALKGFADPVAAFRVLGRSIAVSRFEAKRNSAPAPVQGREGELARLKQRFDVASSGRGQVVLISGDAGIGKSRLVVELYDMLEMPARARVMLQCSPHHEDVPFYPVRTYIEQGAAITTGDPPELRLRKLAAWLREFIPATSEALAIVAELLAIEGGDRSSLTGFGAHEIRARTMKTLIGLLEAVAVTHRILVIEDVHWADPSTSELIGQLAALADGLPVLVVMTMRPGEIPHWLSVANMTVLELDRLHREEVRRLAQRLAAPRVLTDATLEAIVARSDGVPIFVEELTRAVIETGAGDPDASDDTPPIPSTLAESLLARLDRLEHARETAQLAAVIGREFPEVLLLAVSTREPADVEAGVRELLEAGVLQRRRGPFGETLAFRHMLLRDAAYGLMLRRDRALLHRHIADTLESQFPDIVRAMPHIVARHRTLAGDREQAIVLWQRAANDAALRSASAEALAYFDKALALVRELEPARERDETELDLLLGGVGPMIVVRGYGSADVSSEIDRALVLCRALNATHRIVPALYHKWIAVLGAGDHIAMDAIARDMTAAAEDGTVLDKLMAQRVVGSTLLFGGDPAGTVREADRFRSDYDAALHEAALARVSATKTPVTVSLITSEAHWLLGDAAAAAHWRKIALDAAEADGHYNTMCNVIAFLGGPFSVSGDPGEMAAHAAQLRRLSLGHDLLYWRPHADLLAGVADIRSGKETGFAQARLGIEALVERHVFLLGCWATFYARACADFGRLDEVQALLEIADSRSAAGEVWFAAEQARLRARISAKSGDIAGALQALEAARAVATGQGALAFLPFILDDIAALGRPTSRS